MPDLQDKESVAAPPAGGIGTGANEPLLKGVYGFSNTALKSILGVISVVTVVMALCAFFCGILGFFLKTATYFLEYWPSTHSALTPAEPNHSGVLIALIGTVEIFIAAPLPFLVVTALFQYVRAWGINGSLHSAGPEKRLHDTKVLVFSLLLSLLTVDLVSELITQAKVDWKRILNFMLCMLFLAGYILVSNRGKRSLQNP